MTETKKILFGAKTSDHCKGQPQIEYSVLCFFSAYIQVFEPYLILFCQMTMFLNSQAKEKGEKAKTALLL